MLRRPGLQMFPLQRERTAVFTPQAFHHSWVREDGPKPRLRVGLSVLP